MTNKKTKKLYEINPLTMAVMPQNDVTGETNTIVLEETGEYIIDSSPTKLIDLACRYFGSSLEGRLDGTKDISKITHKAPIAIDPSSGMFFFPTTSPRNMNCSWINHSHVKEIQPTEFDRSKVIFYNGEEVIVDVSYGSMMNQLQRTAQFRFSLENRMKKLRNHGKNDFDQTE